MKSNVLAGFLSLSLLAPTVAPNAWAQQQSLPDSPKPQLEGVGPVAPGKGAAPATSTDPNAPSAQLPAAKPPVDNFQTEAPELQMVPQNGGKTFTLPRVAVNFVEVPFSVKDKHGTFVAGLDWRDIQVFENGTRQHMSLFSVDPAPLSIAFVLDQSLPYDVMERVNASLNALQGAFTPYDEIALFTYNNGPQMKTDYTGAQSARIQMVVERSKAPGREAPMPLGGPMNQNININNGAQANTMPLVNTTHGQRSPNVNNLPKETHTLNDAIMAAAKTLRARPQGRRRIIYVVSDGKEMGSTYKTKEVLKYLQTNNITVYATLVGDAATWGVGYLDRFHIPYTMRENVLPQYVAVTGGQAISGYRQRAMEESFQKIGEEARIRYTVGYYSHEAILDGKFRSVEVKVARPNLDVIAKRGYYPSATEANRAPGVAPAAPAAPAVQ